MMSNWDNYNYNEYVRLFQGHKGGVKGTITCFVIKHNCVPKGHMPTFAKLICAYRPHKSEPHWVRMPVGGNIVDYPGEVAANTSNLPVTKSIINIIIYTEDALYMNMDINNYYLGNPLGLCEYIKIAVSMVPDMIMEEYNLYDLIHNGNLYVEVLESNVGTASTPCQPLVHQTPHETQIQPCQAHTWPMDARYIHIKLSLVVDGFGVMCIIHEHREHLKTALEEHYEITSDWTGSLYSGTTTKWDCIKHIVDLSMPGYVKVVLYRFQHTDQVRPQHSPHRH
jgi:hypothetical protein